MHFLENEFMITFKFQESLEKLPLCLSIALKMIMAVLNA